MQIHELTQPRKVNEGLLNTAKAVAQHAIGDYAGSMATSAKELQSRGRDIDSELDPKKSWETKYASLAKDPGIKQYINQLTQEWLKTAATTTPTPTPTTTTSTTATPTTTTSTTATPPAQPIYLGGKRLDPKNPNDAKVLASIQKQGIKESPQEYTSPGGIVVPGGTKTDQAPATPTPTTGPGQSSTNYAGKFKAWVDKKLASRVTNTIDTVDMNQVRTDIPDLATKLDAALKQVALTQNTPQNTVAIQEYLKLALAGTQAVAQYKRGESIRGRTGTATNELGVTNQQLRGLKALAQTPAGKQMLIKQLGL